MSERRITVWACDECDYWRKEKTTGVHVTDNPSHWRGKQVSHELHEVVFVELDADNRAERLH